MTTMEVVISNADQHVMVLATILRYQSQADERNLFFIIGIDTLPLTFKHRLPRIPDSHLNNDSEANQLEAEPMRRTTRRHGAFPTSP